MIDKRLTYLDIAAGIMTIWVMVFHALYPMYGNDELKVVPWLYFFMPWFFYKAGMMYRPRPMLDEIRGGWKKLIATFFIWSFIGWLAHVGWHWFAGDLTPRLAFYSPLRSLVIDAALPLNEAIWFLPVLFLVRIIGNWLLNKHIRPEWIILGSALVALAIKLLNWRLMPEYISGTAWGLFFFACGYALRAYEANKWIVGVAALVFIGSLFTDIPSVYCLSGTPLIQALWYPACVAGCITFNTICRLVARVPVVANAKIGILQYVGKNAMNFYVPHKIIFHIVMNIIVWYQIEWYTSWQGLCIVFAAYAIILPIINWIIKRAKRLNTISAA